MSRNRAARAQETGGAPTEVENQAAAPEELQVDVKEQQAGIASAMGGSDQYAYADKTATPVHERHMQMNSLTEASQAELNPAFTPTPEDGGPVQPDTGEAVGTEPNVQEVQDAQAAEGADEVGSESEAEQK